MLAKAWREHGDVKAAHRLVTSHLRLVVKIANGFRGYGLPLPDMISEGNLGLMHAVKRFDPERGFRLATYAMWWIKASIQEFILRSWSMVRLGTTAAHKRLFFNLRRLKSRMKDVEDGKLTAEQITEISKKLAVSEDDVVYMDGRLSGADRSLNALVTDDGECQWQDMLADDCPSHELVIAEKQETDGRLTMLERAMTNLDERERNIIQKRHLTDEPMSLEEISHSYGISRERVRQLEARAMEKLRKVIAGSVEQN